MAGDRPPQHYRVDDLRAFRITPGDTVKLAVIHHPDDGYDASVSLEVWEPGGSQPLNSHPASVETFYFLRGRGIAICDDEELAVEAGQLLVLPPRSLHRILNTGSGRLFAVTTMAPDAGFAALIEAGEPAELDAAELGVVKGLPG